MWPSITISASAGTSRSLVTALASHTGSPRRKPANRYSSIVGGRGADAAEMLAGSPPRAIATRIVSFRSAISRPCAAPTFWRCPCIASGAFPRTCTRYIPTLRTPVLGSRVITPPSVMYGPPSSGQQIGTGRRARSTSFPLRTISWHGGRPETLLGGNLATSASRGSIASLPSRESGTLRLSSSAMRAPMSSKQATPSANAMRFSEPNRFTATGCGDGAPPGSIGRVNSSAGPPPGDFMQRSAISVISLSTDPGCSTRVRSPPASMAAMNCRRLSSAIVDGADPARAHLVADVPEPRGAQPLGERLRRGERGHRLWQVRVGFSMFGHRAADGGEHASEIEEVQGAQRREAGGRELEHHETGARLQDAVRLAQPLVQIGEIADAEADGGPVERRVRERQLQGVGGDGRGARGRGLAAAPRQHRDDEVGADDAPAEALGAGGRGRQVQRAGAEVEGDAVGSRLPAEPRDGGAAPGAAHIQAPQGVQEAVTRRDGGEQAAHVAPLRLASRRAQHFCGRRRRHRRER